uniref:Synaptotagmin-like protein 5-like n=1 Tax=Saccoglossus kowalevskii TaxID=10224 RepID=A0ABM0LUR5_SACKO|nr:PREDICTED: synaptotagmin-like protein 5-like [Saccoglossus kowalevskii]
MSSSLLNNNNTAREIGDGADSEKDKLSHSGHVASDLSDSEPEIVTEVLSGVAFQRMTVKAGKSQRSPGVVRRGLEVVEENGSTEHYYPEPHSPEHKVHHEEDENIDKHFVKGHSSTGSPARISQLSANTLGSVDSLTSFYSSAGERNFGKITVTGDIKFGLSYNYKTGVFEVKIVACRDLAPVDVKRNTSDPYAKTYLLPDKTKNGKRKTRIKKRTLNPAFDETLKYLISESELQTRTLWISIWHNDAFGHNDFLGEIQLPLDDINLEDFHPEWRPLCPRVLAAGMESTLSYKGDLTIAIKFIPADASNGSPSQEVQKGKSKKKAKNPPEPGKGAIHVHIKDARNLIAVRINGYSDPFAKCYLLPNKSKSGKRKTEVIKKNCNPHWDETFIYEGVNVEDLKERALEVTLWDRESMASNDFLGGLRLGVGNGKSYGKEVKWQDSRSAETALWQRMLDNQNQWVEANLMLRSHMNGKEAKEPEFI